MARPTHLVAIGASAGGLKAIEEFFDHVPEDTSMAFIVIQHLSPKYKSMMPELLSRHSRLPVIRVEHDSRVEPGNVYLIPPNHNLTIVDERLQLSEQDVIRGVNLPIDIFFRSLAEDVAERSVAVVLSGTGSDGTQGVREIKGAGGMVIVQDPDTAQFDGMPRSAIATRLADFVLAPKQMAPKLGDYANHPGLLATSETGQESVLQSILVLLEQQCGTDFSGYRRSTVLRRIEKRFHLNQVEDLPRYLDYVKENPSELNALYEDMLIQVTRFFRDPEHFDRLRSKVIPELWKRAAKRGSGSVAALRVWCAACSTGEEAYSLAIALTEEALRLGIAPDFKLFATDLGAESIRSASAGRYITTIKPDVPPELLNRYFHSEGNTYVVNDSLRKKVVFSIHDLTRDPPFNRVDLVSCRNMLIYLAPELQRRVLSAFAFSLRDRGHLFLGPSESLGDLAPFFSVVDRTAKLFVYEGGAQPTVPAIARRSAASGRIEHTAMRPMVSRPAVESRANKDERSMFRRVMADFAPATAIVNDTHTVLMTYGPIAPYLQIPPGRVTYDLISMAQGTLGALLGTALHKVRSNDGPVEYTNVEVSLFGDGGRRRVDITVAPVPRDGGFEQLYAVIMQPTRSVAPTGEGGAQDPPEQRDARAHLVDLERELQYTKENLQATIEELETSNEELQATNEELLASNEELQSTNEELQSVNEELITVNGEHQFKIAELTEAGNDFSNLLLSAEIHTIFLDRELRIRKFSSGRGPFNLVVADLGRPIGHFSFDLEYPGMLEDIRQVIQTLVPRDHKAPANDGRWYLVKIVPYRTREDEIRGVVVTMIDITERHIMGQRLETLERAQENAGSDVGILLVDDDEDHTHLVKATLFEDAFVNEVHTVHDGQSALEFLRTEGQALPALVVLDLMLPDMHGLDVLKQMKEDPRLRTIPVVIVSAVEDKSEVERAYALGADSYIAKPVTIAQLADAIRAMGRYWLRLVKLPRPSGAPDSYSAQQETKP